MVIIVGIHIHIGSTVREVSVFKDIYDYAKKIISDKKYILKSLKIVNIGGGLAINYNHDQCDPNPEEFITFIAKAGI